MRILVLGAGGVGGYFGGRLAEKGEDVTFLVRNSRKQLLEKQDLVIHSIHGDIRCKPQLLTAADTAAPFDLILFSTKSYHLDGAIKDLKPFVGEETVVLPLLNGIAHINRLKNEFGEKKVIGGLCFIETTLNEQGEVHQTSPMHRVVFGELNKTSSDRIRRIAEVLSGTKASFEQSDEIEQEMWHKYLFITTLSGLTTLMRSPVGPIRDLDGGRALFKQLLEETAEIMKAHGAPIRDGIVEEHMNTIEKMTYSMKSSMQRDMEKGTAIEGGHIHGYLMTLAERHSINAPLLNVIYQNLLIYEKQLKS
ncbi:2-dehydropantoate 2-reductase [Peribacillus deserti]|uniref:2-dehydropantoate 2-reductase n=1 Tax=Peribacillus deserti TaxID=673318 RepID=A0A2N5M546_9BACI|nr:2-dehydropantoate 2-reductase [Peribacillus deserti]PLT29480.1 2-dehydropantoate 2-reductase [Peribacillus deserti]